MNSIVGLDETFLQFLVYRLIKKTEHTYFESARQTNSMNNLVWTEKHCLWEKDKLSTGQGGRGNGDGNNNALLDS